jgi:hypothetical protein
MDIMNSRDSVESIKRTDTLFPSDVNEYDISLADIKEGEKHVKKCLDSFNISVLNRIDADGSDCTVISEYTKYSKYTKSVRGHGLNWSWVQI